MIVVDASVIIKWFIPEVGAAPAKALLSAADELIAPRACAHRGGFGVDQEGAP
jgi:predicted nucleic acid-binding protein